MITIRRNWCIDEGYFVCAKVENLPVTFLIDTGSNVTILKKDLVDQLPSDVCHKIQPTHTKLLTDTGEVVPFLGKVTLNVEIGSNIVK